LPKTVTRQRCDCDLNPGPSAPESSTLTTRLPTTEHQKKTSCRRSDKAHDCYVTVTLCISSFQWRRQGGKGKTSPDGWTSENYVICVCFHCDGTSSYDTTNTLQGRRAKSHVDTQTIQPELGDFVYSRPPIDPYLTSPLLQNPGGAIGSFVISRNRLQNHTRATGARPEYHVWGGGLEPEPALFKR